MGRKKSDLTVCVRISPDERDLIVLLRAVRVSPREIIRKAAVEVPMLVAVFDEMRLKEARQGNEQQGTAEGQSNSVGKGERGAPEKY